MKQQNVDMFMLSKGNLFPASAMMLIRERLTNCDDALFPRIISASFKNPTVGFFYSIGLGTYGADRFYIGHVFIGILKLILTLSSIISYFCVVFEDDPNPILVGIFIIQIIGVLVWYVVDIFKISNEIKEYNYTYLLTLLN